MTIRRTHEANLAKFQYKSYLMLNADVCRIHTMNRQGNICFAIVSRYAIWSMTTMYRNLAYEMYGNSARTLDEISLL